MTKLGIVTGMAFEADILRPATAAEDAPLVACHGFGHSASRRAAAELADQGVEALLSFGIAGGLDPRLATGAIVVATEIRFERRAQVTDAGWTERLHARVGSSVLAPLAHADQVITTPGQKRELHDLTGAVAVDMESWGIAEIAIERGLPFAALRVIADTTDDALPGVALAAVTDDGHVRVMRSVLGALTHPQQIPGLVWLGRRTKTASKVLGDLADLGLARSFFL